MNLSPDNVFFLVGASYIQAIESDHILPIRDDSIPGKGTSQNEAKTKLVQQQLALILHAHKCSRNDADSTQTARQVQFTFCYLNFFLSNGIRWLFSVI